MKEKLKPNFQLGKNKQNEAENQSKNNWLDKLKPCPKNAIIKDKIFSTLNASNLSISKEADKNKKTNEKNIHVAEIFSSKHTNGSIGAIDKWDNYIYTIRKSTQLDAMNEFNDLNFEDQSVVEKGKCDISFSMISENIDEINHLIEEKYNTAMSENLLLRQEYHSIIPFLLISSKSVHRMCLSDYEIKLVIKTFQKRSKCNRLECFDYYKIGLINFFKGNYVNAYNNFKRSYNMKLKDSINSSNNNINNMNNNYNNISSGVMNIKRTSISDKYHMNNKNTRITESTENNSNSPSNNSLSNIAKWLAFSGMILLFCEGSQNSTQGKIDFRNINKIKIEEFEQEENSSNFLFNCCSVRKKGKISDFENGEENNNPKNINNILKSKNTNTNTIIKLDNSLNGNDLNLIKHDVTSIAKEIEELLKIVCENEKNTIEGCWLSMLIGIYCESNKNTKLFKDFFDPKFYVKKIKNLDNYISYIAYAQMMYITKEDFKIDSVLNELIQKFKYRLEAYFFYWHLLYKGKYQNYNTANLLTEILLKITSLMKFDENNIYLMYVTILHTKSAFLIGNASYMISFFQKEYPLNFYYPSLYYLFGKYASKSNLKNLKVISISCLIEIQKLLYEDLQILSIYWLGNIYYNAGDYINCYKTWKKFMENIDKSFNLSKYKQNRVKEFLKKYEILCENLFEFQENINYMQSINYQISINQVDNYFADLNTIKAITPNIKINYSVYYEFLKALIHIHVLKNANEAINILTNILNFNNTFVKAGFELWNLIFKYLKIKVKPQLKSGQNNNFDNSANENLDEDILENAEKAQEKLNTILLKYSYFLVKLTHNDEISTSDWVKAYLKYSKALYLNQKYDKCISVLINLLDIFSVIPLDEIKFLNEVNKKNKISLINNYINFDVILKFYSKIQVYKKCEEVFYENHIKKPYLFGDINVDNSENDSQNENSGDEYDENSSRSEMSKSISKYGNKYFEDSFNKSDEDGKKEKEEPEKKKETDKPANESKELDNYDSNFAYEDNNENKLDDSLNIELEKKKMKSKNENKKIIKGKSHKNKIDKESSNTKNKENGKKVKSKNESIKNLISDLKVKNEGKNVDNNIDNLENGNIKLKLLDPDAEINKTDLSNNEKIVNKNKVNIEDYSLIGTNKDKNKVKNEIVKRFEKNNLEEDNMEELYTDNLDNEDDIYQEGNESKYKIPDLNIKSLSKFEEYLDNNTENIEIPLDNFTFITIISNPLIFYYIGKYCAKSNTKLELGLICLSDFNHILKFQDNYNLTSKNEIKKIKSNFWKGIILILQRQYKFAKEKLEKIQKILEINEKFNKANFIRKFFDWYGRFISHATYEDFHITNKDLFSL